MTKTPEQLGTDRMSTTITLNTPIARGDQSIDSVQLRKPNAGALRGMTTRDVIGGDVSTHIKLLPRITEPALTADEVANMELDDFSELQGQVINFFMTPAQKAAMAEMQAEG